VVYNFQTGKRSNYSHNIQVQLDKFYYLIKLKQADKAITLDCKKKKKQALQFQYSNIFLRQHTNQQ